MTLVVGTRAFLFCFCSQDFLLVKQAFLEYLHPLLLNKNRHKLYFSTLFSNTAQVDEHIQCAFIRPVTLWFLVLLLGIRTSLLKYPLFIHACMYCKFPYLALSCSPELTYLLSWGLSWLLLLKFEYLKSLDANRIDSH